MEYTITLTDSENKALAHVAVDPQEWIDNAVKERCRLAIEEIFQREIQRMVADPTITEIPADRDAVVLAADILSAAERNAMEFE
jgi:SRSO17 transposase